MTCTKGNSEFCFPETLNVSRGNRLFTALYFLVMNSQIQSRENWTPAQNGNLKKPPPTPACFALASLAFFFACVNYFFLLRSQTPPPTPACFALASLAFSFACVNYREAVNSLRGKTEGNIEVEGKQISMFPAGSVIKCFVIPPNSKIEKKV